MMTVQLTSELEALIQSQIEVGPYASAEEVMTAALMRLRDDPAVESFDNADLAALDEAERQIAAGEDRPWDEVEAELRRKYLAE